MSTRTTVSVPNLGALRAQYTSLAAVFRSNQLDLVPFSSRLKGETDPLKVRDGVSAMRQFLIYRGFLENDPDVSAVSDDNRPEYDLACREYVEDYMSRVQVREASQPAQVQLGVTPQPGKFYMVGSVPFEAVMSRNGMMYARRRHNDTGKWEYAKGAIFAVRDNGREATVEDIAKFSLRHRRCFVCGRKLQTEKSVAKGIGPVCEKTVKFGRKSA